MTTSPVSGSAAAATVLADAAVAADGSAVSGAAAGLPRCVLLATGGTIAMRPGAAGGSVPVDSGTDLVAAVPALAGVARMDVRNLFNVASANMGPERWRLLHDAVMAALRDDDVAGCVVTHGTDTLEETAWFLALTVRSRKPVVLTGAQRDAAAADGDGPRNLLDAVRVAVDPASAGRGVLVVFNGQVHAAREVGKTHTSDVDAFDSGEAGLLGRVDDRGVRFWRAAPAPAHLALGEAPLPPVEIVPVYAGATPVLLRAAMAAGARGIVVQALGLGNVNEALHDAIADACAEGIAVVIATRVAHGGTQPRYGYVGGGQQLQALGAILAGTLSAPKARILLMLALQQADADRPLADWFGD